MCRGKIFLQDEFLDVAVKRLKSGATSKDHLNFLREASTMAQFIHPNVIELKGAVTKSMYSVHESVKRLLGFMWQIRCDVGNQLPSCP